MKTCAIGGCIKPYRARGLCSTHYNQANKRLVEMPCAWCGTLALKLPTGKYARRFCGLTCRDEWRWWNSIPLACSVPDTHPSRSSRVPENHPSRIPMVCDVPLDHPSRRPRRVLTAGNCADCSAPFIVVNQWDTQSRYCSKRCMVRVARRSRRAREHGATGSFTWDAFARLALSLGGQCAYCGGDNDGLPLEPDHVVPLSRRGHNGLTNILPVCGDCNRSKSDRSPLEWAALCKERGHPIDYSRFTHLTAAIYMVGPRPHRLGPRIRTDHAA